MSELLFDPVEHAYTVNGKRLPSVTQILAPLVDYSMVPRDVLERAQKLGTAVHRMTELYDLDDLDMDCLADELVPYLTAWIKFRAESGFVPETIEKRLYHPSLRFAGTPDRSGLINGRRAVIDIKKMLTLGPVIGLQLAAYSELFAKNGTQIEDRYGLGLRADGTYRLVPFKDKGDWPVFLSLLTIRNWKDKNGQATAGESASATA
ncbi:PD-(D/E)XK nuclease family protein [Paraburkholderia sp. CNPSo 3274]|uniref:PD-(D/E)XK nuclease family protein n=1 Tax=Paraburkholderia sp. CNPSo 3274 TaxID=2940932 RepID=UPI0020B6D65E|nr:PD-(D/E)XK nuclease family protein [Paraburkholderia sp. CNPSo 3274]MCP3709763.1 PD-(D/E)XK nuclease family protein [Paraburkholderia sp. CNPSo 3274]